MKRAPFREFEGSLLSIALVFVSCLLLLFGGRVGNHQVSDLCVLLRICADCSQLLFSLRLEIKEL